ncbi:hypothetical protein [Clostridium tagluense]|uniref:Nudix hydrolase domain-containing protein n=1 Tax=Clostridium tagluense TaxID=360422 RepID=A0A401UQ96_9CLOT|nr:hypothetical protein [Clostridium tagluense]GCD11733.1 hypothetical protein Ctaglu_33560 [Clostridium tagluense]
MNKLNKKQATEFKNEMLEGMNTVKDLVIYDTLNQVKSQMMEIEKPKLNEMILFFKEGHLGLIPTGYSEKEIDLTTIPMHFGKRSICEHDKFQRHPIPYMLVKHAIEDKYFFIFRESGSNELRLIGKKGMAGGHVGIEDYCENINYVISSGMYRELEEEIGITQEMIQSLELIATIKDNVGINADHLALVYKITIDTNDIKSEEIGVQSGMWLNKEDILSHFDEFEDWSQQVIKNYIFKEGVIE